ncbi:MAG: tetratricopeptide repeat protein [Saprospiraceae bacterium]
MKYLLALLFICPLLLGAQQTRSPEGRADSILRVAINLMDAGSYSESIAKLEEAKSVFPNPVYDYEIALAHYRSGDYGTAAKILRRVIKKGYREELCYTLLGNAYDLLGQRAKAMKTYDGGLKRYPDSGPLHLEKGIVFVNENRLQDALNTWEKGLTVDPHYPSNFYQAAKMLTRTEERLWVLLYGEMFLNTEFNTRRTAEMSELLFKQYFDIYVPTSDTSGEFSLIGGRVLYIDLSALRDADPQNSIAMEKIFNSLLSFSQVASTKFMLTAPLYQNGLPTIDNLIAIRSSFIDDWYADPTTPENYPNALLDYLHQVREAGHFEPYNYYIFRHALPEMFDIYLSIHRAEFEDFIGWYDVHNMDVENLPYSRLSY